MVLIVSMVLRDCDNGGVAGDDYVVDVMSLHDHSWREMRMTTRWGG